MESTSSRRPRSTYKDGKKEAEDDEEEKRAEADILDDPVRM